MAAPLGNMNAAKGKIWNDALRKAIAQDDGKRLHAAAEMLLNKASEGEPWAVKEIADRLDGKVAQAIDLGSDPERPMIQKLIREIVRPEDKDG